jgi:hypothetical protein
MRLSMLARPNPKSFRFLRRNLLFVKRYKKFVTELTPWPVILIPITPVHISTLAKSKSPEP